MTYTKDDYQQAVEFALNYPSEVGSYYYDMHMDLYNVDYMEGGWYSAILQGSFVRSCLKWKGIKKWVKEEN